MKSALIAVLMLRVGAWGQEPTRAHKDVATKQPGIFVRLGDYALSRGIRFRILCTSDENRESYFAWAVQPGARFELYIEDGAKDDWAKSKFGSREAAATWLLEALHRQPNERAEHNKKDRPEKKKRCLSPVTSENYKERHDLPCPECSK